MPSSIKQDMELSLIDEPRVNTFIDIGCICGLTPTGKSSIPNG